MQIISYVITACWWFRAVFHKYCCHIKRGGIITNLPLQHLWHSTDMSIYHIVVYGAWVKRYCFLFSKHIAHQSVCYNFPLARDKPIGAHAFVRLVYSMALYPRIVFKLVSVIIAFDPRTYYFYKPASISARVTYLQNYVILFAGFWVKQFCCPLWFHESVSWYIPRMTLYSNNVNCYWVR